MTPRPSTTPSWLKGSGQALARVRAIYAVWTSNLLTDELEAVQTEMDPRLAAFQDSITHNARLFARIEAVYQASTAKGSTLTPEQQRLSWLYWNNFLRAGARLDAGKKVCVGEIDQRLASLFARLGQNLRADEDTTLFFKLEDLVGLPLRALARAKC